jgi:hypothetical protein
LTATREIGGQITLYDLTPETADRRVTLAVGREIEALEAAGVVVDDDRVGIERLVVLAFIETETGRCSVVWKATVPK